MKIFKLFFLLSLVVILSSCGSEKNNSYENVDQLVSEAQPGIVKVTVAELKEIIDHNTEYKIIDCREKEEYTEGHIPGAINIPRGVLEFSHKISNRRKTIFVYSLNNDRSSLAYQSLKLLKYNKVFLIDGGWQEWNNKFPEIIEKGDGNAGAKIAPKVEESGGCGG